jgi:hypothetical protein
MPVEIERPCGDTVCDAWKQGLTDANIWGGKMILSRKLEKSSTRPPDPVSTAECSGGEQNSAAEDGYQPPALLDLGPVWQVTLGSSSSGNADANSHYYW